MADLKDLLAQRAALERQIEQARRKGRADAISQVRSLMAEHGLTLADLGARAPKPDTPAAKAPKAAKPARAARKGPAPGAKVPAKFRDAATGQTWSGRGLQPNWLKAALAAGRTLDEFRI